MSGLAYGIGGLVKTAPGPVSGRGAPSSSFRGQLGQQYFDTSTTPATEYVYNGSTWEAGGNALATTTTPGIVTLFDTDTFVGADDTTVPTSLTVKTYVDATAIAGSPVSTETTAGIGQLATNAEAVAGTPSTGLLALFVTPSNLASVFAAPPAIGGTTPAAATFTDLTATGTISVSSAAPITIDVTGAGNDLTLSSDAGRVIVNGEEAAANAITLLSVAGGIDADAALQINIATSQNAADAIVLNASAGGIDITAAGASAEDIDIVCTSGSINLTAGESIATSMVFTNTGMDIVTSGAADRDIDITNTGGSINITATENNAGAIVITSNGGASERITLNAAQGTGADSINLNSTAGGITLTAALATADAINLNASNAAGGIDIDCGTGGLAADSTGAIVVTSTANSAASIYLHANGGISETIRLHADQGTGVASININSDVGGVTVSSGLGSADAINLTASNAAGGIDIDSGTAGFIVDTTGGISLDSAAASNFTATGAFDLTIQSTAGSVIVSASEDAADAVQVLSTAGGIDILATGEAGQDIDIANTGGSVNISATEDNAGAITIGTNGGTSERITVTCSQGTNAASIGLVSTAGGITLTAGLGTADAVNINTSNAAGGIDVDAGTAGVIVDTTGAISLDSAAASNFTVTGAFDLTLNSTAGSVNITAGETAADSMVLTNTGMDIVTSGASGRDIDITNTGGSINITATESASDAIVINASGAASGITLDCGTASLTIGTGIKHAVTSTNTAATPYAVLGTDYFISTDTTGGAMTVTLPAVPGTGRTVVIYDGAGQAAAGGNVTIDGNGNNIAAAGTSAATKLINTAYESYILTFNGTIWCGQNIV